MFTQSYSDASSLSPLSEMEVRKSCLQVVELEHKKKSHVDFNLPHPVIQGTVTIAWKQESENRKAHLQGY